MGHPALEPGIATDDDGVELGGFVMRPLHTLEEIGLTVAVVLLLLTPMLDPVVSLVAAAGLLILLGVIVADRPGPQRR